MSPATVDALVVGGEDGASLPPIVNCDNASHATSRYFNESNQPFSRRDASLGSADLAIGT
jgi:hypothetical protein